MDDNSIDIPSHKELEKEISDYLAKKYGGKVRVVSQMIFPKQIKPEETDDKGQEASESEGEIAFDLKPEDLKTYLDQYVIKQDRAKTILATKICTHFNRIAYLRKKGKRLPATGFIKNNIILVGPTGVGKTFLIKLIAEKIGVPFVKGDATKFSETGYVGGDVEDLVRDLVQEADGDISKAQYGIIYVDEIDKIASSAGLHGPDVSRSGVQRALLKPLEETTVDLRVPHDPISQIEAIERFRRSGKREKQSVNTRHILFIVSGAFSGLEDMVKRRLSRQGMGFGAEIDVQEGRAWLEEIKPQDFIEYGFESEFIGRLPVTALLHELSEDDLCEILLNPNCAVVLSKKQDFRAYGIDLKFEDDALRLLARQACQERTGARALVSVVERALLPFERKLPSTDVTFLVVTREMVEDPEGQLGELLAAPFAADRVERYKALVERERDQIIERLNQAPPLLWEEHGIPMTPQRVDCIAKLVQTEDLEPSEASETIYHHIQKIKGYEASFFKRCGIRLTIEDEAVDRLLTNSLSDFSTLYSQCERLCNILEYGLTLVKEKTGREHFLVHAEAIENPELYINKLIRACYQGPSHGDTE